MVLPFSLPVVSTLADDEKVLDKQTVASCAVPRRKGARPPHLLRYTWMMLACLLGCVYLDDGAAEKCHELRMHRAQKRGSQAAQLRLERGVTWAALLGTLGLQAGYIEACPCGAARCAQQQC